MVIFNIMKPELDNNYYKIKKNNYDNLLSIGINCERNLVNTINIKYINDLFNEKDNIFNYIKCDDDNIKVSVSDGKINYLLECGLGIIKTRNPICSALQDIILCESSSMRNFFKTIEEVKKRKEKYNPSSNNLIYTFEFVSNKQVNNLIITEKIK